MFSNSSTGKDYKTSSWYLVYKTILFKCKDKHKERRPARPDASIANSTSQIPVTPLITDNAHSPDPATPPTALIRQNVNANINFSELCKEKFTDHIKTVTLAGSRARMIRLGNASTATINIHMATSISISLSAIKTKWPINFVNNFQNLQTKLTSTTEDTALPHRKTIDKENLL
jgi:hypothetical protein